MCDLILTLCYYLSRWCRALNQNYANKNQPKEENQYIRSFLTDHESLRKNPKNYFHKSNVGMYQKPTSHYSHQCQHHANPNTGNYSTITAKCTPYQTWHLFSNT